MEFKFEPEDMEFKFEPGDMVEILDGSQCSDYTGGWFTDRLVGVKAKIYQRWNYCSKPAYRLSFDDSLGQTEAFLYRFFFIFDERYLARTTFDRTQRESDDDFYGMECKR